MFSTKLLLFALGACLAGEGYCSVSGPKDSANGVRGRGQRMPQVFDLGSLEELKDIASQFNGKDYSSRLQKRQADLQDLDLSTAAILTNDSHFHAIVHWTGYPHENIFILTRQPSESTGLSIETWLWRSTDYGKTFINETDKLEDYLIQSYYVGVNTSYLVFADVINQTLQVTEDVGETFTARSTPFTPNSIIFQSRLAPNSTQYSKFILSQDYAEEALWVSSNLGVNWTKIGDNVPFQRFYWRRLNEEVEGDLTTVYFEQRTSKESTQSLLYFSTYPYTEVQLFAPELGPFESGSFVMTHEYMFVRISGSAANSNVTYSSPLWVSYRRDRIFRQALFPFLSDELEHLHYSVIDGSEGEVLVGIYHNNITSHLYISDATGTSYSLSLDYIVQSGGENGDPTFDVHLVDGIRGAVLANRKVPGDSFGGTLISHNKGGQWSPLQAPAVDRNGLPTSCFPPGCSLHVRMETDVENGYQSILSQDTAVGLIMAAGNLGTGFSTAANSRIYLSRDGGFTWAEVESGNWEFQFLALGSIIVMVNKRILVDDFKWSCDEGATWMTNKLEKDVPLPRVAVIGMKTEIGEKPRLVSVFGVDFYQYITNNLVFEWIVFTLNFTSVVPRQCDTFDYFEWVPTDDRLSESCLLGEVVLYERRNGSACCYVDPDYQKPVNTSRCRCSLEDFECDLGFARQTLNSPCTAVPGHVYPPPAPIICPESNNYTYSSGYRKIPGDKCEEENINVDFLLPQTAPCPLRAAGGLSVDFPESIRPDEPVTFTLSQSRGSKLSTVYVWSFGDSTPLLQNVSLISAQTQQHSFASPGMYRVTVSTRNDAGLSEISVSVTVLDTLIGFSVGYPSELYIDDSVPIGFYIRFTVSISTQFGTRHLGEVPFELAWDFGDGTNFTAGPQAIVGHVYESPGNYTVSTSLTAVFSNVEKIKTKSIRTYAAATNVNITSDALIIKEGIAFTQVGQYIDFQVSPPSFTEIPPQTAFSWLVQRPRQSSSETVGTERTIAYQFPTWGQYSVTMRGSYLATGSVQGVISVYAQNNITVVAPSKQTARSGQLITLNLILQNSQNSPYQGPINVTLESPTGSRLANYHSIISDDAEIKLHFTMKQPGSTDAILRASNDVSKYMNNLKLVVVGSGDFGAITILFDADKLPSNYNTPEWQEKLSYSLRQFIAMKFDGDASLIEVVGVSTIVRTDSRKRSPGMFLALDVNLLPADYTEQAFQDTMQMADKVLADIADEAFTFNVDDVVLTADSAVNRNDNDRSGPEPVSSNPLVDIVLAVVFTIILVAVIVVVVIISVYCYRRNKQLQMKYSMMEEPRDGNLSFNEAFGESADTKESGNE